MDDGPMITVPRSALSDLTVWAGLYAMWSLRRYPHALKAMYELNGYIRRADDDEQIRRLSDTTETPHAPGSAAARKGG